MEVLLPPMKAFEVAHRCGPIEQLAQPATRHIATVAKYTNGSDKGHLVTGTNGDVVAYVFAKPPVGAFKDDAPVLVAKGLGTEIDDADLRKGYWVQHPHNTAQQTASARDAALSSWINAFQFTNEASSGGRPALRSPQVGALHAIHAHWSTSIEVATVVMPTGTGKTETMLSTLVSDRCSRVLVIVPTDALRTQIANKFLTLGLLKAANNAVLLEGAHRPVVGTLLKKPSTIEEVDTFFGPCNVVVTTSQLAGGCSSDVQAQMAKQCTHLFIDEAHHVEANTWRDLKAKFSLSRVLQFTATPFREDGQLIDGRVVYIYPLRKAMAEGYFRPISFSSVYEFDVARADQAIAAKAIEELDSDITGKHVVMARVANIKRAEAVFETYRAFDRFEPVMLHTGLSSKARTEAIQKLESGQSRIVVCVDMLGEGFDMPELKIAAFHDIRKSLAVTLQLAGRFTRSRADLGDPVFIANIANLDVRDELLQLYAQDPDWNELLPDLSDEAIADEVGAQEYMRGFDRSIDSIPLKDLRPSASTVIYKTTCANWTPRAFRAGLRGLKARDKVLVTINERENTLVALTARETGVPWTSISSVTEWHWELFVSVWDREKSLLFIHGSSNSSEFKDVAKAIGGRDVVLIADPQVYRVLHGINRLLLTNVGLDEHFGRQIRYTGRMGADVAARLGDATRQSARKAVVAGAGFENGTPVTIGAAKRGRVWSVLRLRVDTFAKWCRHLATKIVDESIDPDEVLKGTLIPKIVAARPEQHPIGVDWPLDFVSRQEHQVGFVSIGRSEVSISDVEFNVLDGPLTEPLILELRCDEWTRQVLLEIFPSGDTTDYRFSYVGAGQLDVRTGASGGQDLCQYLTAHPPTVWFADGSSLEGNLLVELPRAAPQYDTDKLQVLDWSGIDLTKESQHATRRTDSIQFRLLEQLRKKTCYAVLFDDDDAGEAADVVGIKVQEDGNQRRIEVEFYHCKFSSGQPGSRVDDFYAVCGQAQKSLMWLFNKEKTTDLFAHLLKREERRLAKGLATRFEIGDKATLARVRELSRRHEVRLSVYVVQPGLSKHGASAPVRVLLGATERYLYETYQVPFIVVCSS